MQKVGNTTDTADANGEYTNGNVAQGIPPTIINAEMLNTFQREMVNVVEGAGLVLNPANNSQLIESIKSLLDMAIPPGIPFPWPRASIPTGWLKCNGDPFDKGEYPKLALAYPNGMLPDLRGEFIRGWDDGRGVDVDRGILTSQESTQIYDKAGWTNSPAGGYVTVEMTNPDGTGTTNGSFSTQRKSDATSDPGSTRYPVRPRNVAFCYIVRAA